MTNPASGPERDPGLQVERTSLAWQRTALSGVGAMVLLLRTSMTQAGPFLVLTAVAVMCAVGAVVWLRRAGRRPPRLPLMTEQDAGRPVKTHGLRMSVLAALSATLSCIGLVQVVTRGVTWHS